MKTFKLNDYAKQNAPAGRIPQPVNVPLTDKLYLNLHDYYCPVGIPFRIPGGWINDGASSPRFGYFVIRPDGLIRAGALVHDFICDNSGRFRAMRLDGIERDFIFTWSEAARLFHTINLSSGLSQWKCHMAHEGVRLWGVCKDW